MLFMLPFVTVLREGLEAVVFVGGVCRTGLVGKRAYLTIIARSHLGSQQAPYLWLHYRDSLSGLSWATSFMRLHREHVCCFSDLLNKLLNPAQVYPLS
jgi:hypothetical protein